MVKRRGLVVTGCLVYLALIAIAIYIGSPVATAYFRYYRFRDAMGQEAKYAFQRTDTDIQLRLRLFADSLGLPEQARYVDIRRGSNRMRISSEYVEEISIPVIGKRAIGFHPAAEEHF
jgi:hypothetical protein